MSVQVWIVVSGGWESTMLELNFFEREEEKSTFLPDKIDNILNLTIFRSVLDSC